MGGISKLIGSAIGGAVGAGLAWLVAKVPGIGSCSVVDTQTACEVLGLTQAQITGALSIGMSMVFTYFFPANKA